MTRSPKCVLGPDGLRGTVEAWTSDEGRVSVRLEGGRIVDVPAELLTEQNDGSLWLDLNLGAMGPLDALASPTRNPTGQIHEGQAKVIPVIREELDVTKRTVETGAVKIHKRVRRREEVVEMPLLRETLEVEHVPINRMIPGPMEPRQDGATWIIPLVEEILVVEKRLFLREEVRVTRRQVEERHSEVVTLLSEEAEIERSAIEGVSTPIS